MFDAFTKPPAQWKINHHQHPNYYEIRDANGHWIVNFVYYNDAVRNLGVALKAFSPNHHG